MALKVVSMRRAEIGGPVRARAERARRSPRCACGGGSRGRATTATAVAMCRTGCRGLEARSSRPRDPRPPRSPPRSKRRSAACHADTPAGARGGSTPSWLGPASTPPAVATIHRALRRNHLVSPQPRRRPKADKRFEREARQRPLADRRHPGLPGRRPRRPGSSTAWTTTRASASARSPAKSPTGEAAWESFREQPARLRPPSSAPFRQREYLHRPPAWRRGRLRAAPRRSRGRPDQRPPLHPQTLGKLERFHRT